VEIVIAATLIAAVAALCGGLALVALLFRGAEARERRVADRVRALATGGLDLAGLEIVRRDRLSEISLLDRLLRHLRPARVLDELVRASGVPTTVGAVVLAAAILALLGGAALWLARLPLLTAVGGGAFCGMLPLAYLRIKRRERIRRFEAQLPEAMDLVSRALRSGHAFNNALGMVGQEFEDPMGMEFRKVSEEINFGLGTRKALENLRSRMDLPEVRFFVVAVTIQSESGGNLAEILDTIAAIIRERFDLRRQVRVLSAQGRFSAVVLAVLPFCMGLYLYIQNRDYLMLMVEHHIGRYVLVGAFALMGVGILAMKRMVTIEV
jgi:tight adherence protein B